MFTNEEITEAKKLIGDSILSDTEIGKILEVIYRAARLALDRLEEEQSKSLINHDKNYEKQ